MIWRNGVGVGYVWFDCDVKTPFFHLCNLCNVKHHSSTDACVPRLVWDVAGAQVRRKHVRFWHSMVIQSQKISMLLAFKQKIAGSCTEPCVDVKAHSALKPLLIPSRLNPTPYTETLPPNGGDYNTFPDAISWEANGDDMDGGRRCMHVWLYRCGPLHSGIHTLASVRPDRKASPDPSDLQQTPCISSDFLTDNQHRAFHHTFRPTTNTPSYDPHPAFPDPSTFLAPPPKTAPAMHCGV